jgi:hypothetical protein
VLKKEQKTSVQSIIQGLVLSEGAIDRRHKFMIENSSAKITSYLRSQVVDVKLKATSLNSELLFYIRVNCAWFYHGVDLSPNKADQSYWRPSDIDFEFIVL